MRMRVGGIFVSFVVMAAWAWSGCTNHAPRIIPIGDKSIETGKTIEIEVRAVDGDNDPLTFAFSFDSTSQDQAKRSRFEGLNATTALFQWTPIASDAGKDGKGKTYSITFQVSDGIATASETIMLTVTLGGGGEGTPVFISPRDYTLDLDRSNQIKINIEVRDPDSANVEMRLVDEIPGAKFAAESKRAVYEWRPADEQLATPVWGFRVEADDGVNPPKSEDFTILLKGGQKKCPGTPPVVQHTPLPDQKGEGDYVIEATATDLESTIASVMMYFLIAVGDEPGGEYKKVTLQSTDGKNWQGTIKNPGLGEGESAAVSYYICTTDDDDKKSDKCDHRACSPAEGRYSFTAYGPGVIECRDDDLPPNNDGASATLIEFDSQGSFSLSDLKICPADEDWLKLTQPAGYRIKALASFQQVDVPMLFDLYGDEEGVEVLAQSDDLGGGRRSLESKEWTPADQEMTLFLRVHGDTGEEENGFGLQVELAPRCYDDEFETNNGPVVAKDVVQNQEYPSLNTCDGNEDWYKVTLSKWDSLEVVLDFDSAKGEIDLAVYDARVIDANPTDYKDIALVWAYTNGNQERGILTSAPEDGDYFIAVVPFERAENDYAMKINVTTFGECTNDSDEPNEYPAQASDYNSDSPQLVLCPYEEDWYKISRAAGRNTLIKLSFVNDDGDLDLYFYKPGIPTDREPTPAELNEFQVGSSTSEYADLEQIEYTIPDGEPGIYFVRVDGVYGAKNTYTLEVKYQ